MRDLLFLCHRIPYPPTKGDKIRTWNLLRHLARRYRIHLGCFVDQADDRVHEPVLRALCADAFFAPLTPAVTKARAAAGLFGADALSARVYRDRAFVRWIDEMAVRVRPSRVLAVSSTTAPLALRPSLGSARRVLDFVDVDSEKWRAYAATARWPMSLVYRREAWTLARLERRAAVAADATVFVSPSEADLFRRLFPQAARVHVVANGVDADYFRPGAGQGVSIPSDVPIRPGERMIVFTGAMDYRPNIEAVQWFADAILPLIRRHVPDSRFVIVGSDPAPAVTRLARRPGIAVTGRVPDVRPWLEAAAVAVAPLRVARGVQNKVLEAMAMARPVVVTRAASYGIAAEDGRDLLVADDPRTFAEAVIQALHPPFARALGQAARARVLAVFDWRSNLDRMEAILEADGVRAPVHRAPLDDPMIVAGREHAR